MRSYIANKISGNVNDAGPWTVPGAAKRSVLTLEVSVVQAAAAAQPRLLKVCTATAQDIYILNRI